MRCLRTVRVAATVYPFDLPVNDTMFFSLKAIAAQRLAAGRPDFVFAAHPDAGGYFALIFPHFFTISSA